MVAALPWKINSRRPHIAAVIRQSRIQTMRYCFLLTFALIVIATTSLAEPPAKLRPTNLIGFLKPGTHVGMTSEEGTNSVNLLIFDDDEYAVALDISKSLGEFVDAESLAKKHKLVRTRLDSHLARMSHREGAGTKSAIRVYPLRRMFVGTIRSVGDDYVLIEYVRFFKNDEKSVQVVVSNSAIARIYPDSDPIHFSPL